ncbi:MAG: DUF4411 family protein [Methylococcales bacterium]
MASILHTQYLLDANIFIQAKNLYYRFEFCQSFWDFLAQAHRADIVFSIEKVKVELKKGHADDPIIEWMNHSLPTTFFLDDVNDANVMTTYRQVMRWITLNTHYTQQAKDEFARFEVADAFLIAVAKTYGHTIITHEKSQPEAKKRVLIPDVAKAFDVETIMIYDFLSRHAESGFSLKG